MMIFLPDLYRRLCFLQWMKEREGFRRISIAFDARGVRQLADACSYLVNDASDDSRCLVNDASEVSRYWISTCTHLRLLVRDDAKGEEFSHEAFVVMLIRASLWAGNKFVCQNFLPVNRIFTTIDARGISQLADALRSLVNARKFYERIPQPNLVPKSILNWKFSCKVFVEINDCDFQWVTGKPSKFMTQFSSQRVCSEIPWLSYVAGRISSKFVPNFQNERSSRVLVMSAICFSKTSDQQASQKC